MMNSIDERRLNQGLSYGQFRETKVEDNASVFDQVYADPTCTEEDLAFLRRLPPLSIVALAEDWCPDVFHTLPTWARVAEEVEGWSLRVFPRDEHPGLMNAFLWKGSAKRIPVYAFYDRRNRLQVWWSGRSREAAADLEDVLGGVAWSEADEETRERARELFETEYPRRYRRANFEEILDLLAAFFHESRETA